MIIKRKHKLIFSFLFFVLLLAGCSQSSQTAKAPAAEPSASTAADTPALPSQEQSASNEPAPSDDYFHDYVETGGEVALITDFTSIMDHGFNEAAYEGTKTYAQAAGISYSYYSAANASSKACKQAIEAAIDDGSRLLICAGSNFQETVVNLQALYPEIDFLLLDGIPINESETEIVFGKNVHCISYKENEAGYLAGYIAVLEGYTQFGFIGGKDFPPVIRYGYGYLQGINDAAVLTGIESKIDVKYWYSDTFNPNTEITQMAQDWYQSGTEIIFSCGGAICESVITAAELEDGKVIGVDINQGYLSPRVVTSAMKEIKNSVIMTLDDYRANGDCWNDESAGRVDIYGASEKCIALPTDNDSWRFQHVTKDAYYALYAQLKKGEIIVNNSTLSSPSVSINITYMNP